MHFYLVGIKGTGMTAFAELLSARGAKVSGSDVEDTFYTDEILISLNIPFSSGFSASNLDQHIDCVVYSAAYDKSTHPELLEAERRAIPLLEYTEALGAFSSGLDSSGVAGVHGKTSTTGMCGTLVKHLGLKGSVLVGSGVSNFDGRSTLSMGSDFFVAETCEYRRHFLHFCPSRIILTSVEIDHLDYFKDFDDIVEAFVSYGLLLPQKGELIFCADDHGARLVAAKIAVVRPDIVMTDYGFSAKSNYRIIASRQEEGRQVFSLEAFKKENGQAFEFFLQVPGLHNILNASAALALLSSIYRTHYGKLDSKVIDKLAVGLASFKGCKRRSEVLGEVKGILFMDDYAHHPTAIRTTLEGYRRFYPSRRLVVDFMSHTYSRTKALLQEFARSFGDADLLLLHEIYASAREQNPGDISGQTLFESSKRHHAKVEYFPQVMDACDFLRRELRAGDVFVTMGAGDNWKLGRALFDELKQNQAKSARASYAL